MKSYETIRRISSNLYRGIKDESDVKNRIEASVNEIHSQISEDFKDMFGQELNLIGFHIYVDDQTYRQSATGLILEATVLNNENFKFRAECLIDHGKIWVKVIEGKDLPDFKPIVNRIESVQNFEGLSELREIR